MTLINFSQRLNLDKEQLGDLTPRQFAEQFESQKSNFLAGTIFG
jgi:hypothetical protein